MGLFVWEGLVVEVDPAAFAGSVGEGDGSFGAEEEAGFGVVGVEAFVAVEGGKGGGVVGEGEEVPRDSLVFSGGGDEGWVFAEVVEDSADGGGADGGELAGYAADLLGGAVGVEGAVDEDGFADGGPPGDLIVVFEAIELPASRSSEA